jgi:DNA-binding response OmpR family regulator
MAFVRRRISFLQLDLGEFAVGRRGVGTRSASRPVMLCAQRHSDRATILIVEDDAILGQVLERVLTGEGQTALHVSGANQALRLVENRWPRLVLVDTGLRDGTALELGSRIRARDPIVPLLFLTAHSIGDSTFPTWVNRLVTKSITLTDLRKAIKGLLAGEKTNSQTDLMETFQIRNFARSRQLATTANY